MILVLGGNGFIGYNLVKRFVLKEKIRVFDRNWTHEINNTNIEIVLGDFGDTNFDILLEDIDIVFHLISSSVPYDGTDGLLFDIENDLLPTVRFLNSMKKKKVKKIFFISSGGSVYGECLKPAQECDKLSPECIYAAQKSWIETCLHLYEKYDGILGYVLRVGNPYGLEVNRRKRQGIIPIFTEKILSGDIIEIWGNGENKRDYIYIDEVIDAIEAVYLYHGRSRIFNIGTGNSYSTRDIIGWIEDALCRKAKVIYKKERQCDLMASWMDVTLIYSECGWKSRLAVDQGIRLYIDRLINTKK